MIIRVSKNRQNPFVMMDRRPLEDDRLSFKAKGILAYLLSRPDDWTVIIGDLVNRGTDGRLAVQSALGELREFGYAKLQTIRSENGLVAGKEWVILENPEIPTDSSVSRLSVNTDSSVSRQTVSPIIGKSATTNTESFTKTEENIPPVEAALSPSEKRRNAWRLKCLSDTFNAQWKIEYEKYHPGEQMQLTGPDKGQIKLFFHTATLTPRQIVEVAVDVWKNGRRGYWCDKLHSPFILLSKWSDIRAEIKNGGRSLRPNSTILPPGAAASTGNL